MVRERPAGDPAQVAQAGGVIDEHPLPWLTPLLNGVEHASFFEQPANEYSKGATRGNWGEVWEGFNKRQKAKARAVMANDEPGEEADGDMFSRAGVTAE